MKHVLEFAGLAGSQAEFTHQFPDAESPFRLFAKDSQHIMLAQGFAHCFFESSLALYKLHGVEIVWQEENQTPAEYPGRTSQPFLPQGEAELRQPLPTPPW